MDARSDEDCCADEFFRRLQGLRSEGHLTDVTLCAEGKEIPCHRLVLSACSDYFHAMFGGAHSESKKEKIEIGGVTAEALQLLVDFAYTPKFNITLDNVYHQFEAANMLQVKPIEDACEKFLINNLSPDMCLGTWTLADKLSCMKLSAVARRFALKNFEEVCATEEFLQLPVDFLKTYISDRGLHAKKETQVLGAIMLWTRHDLKHRKMHLKELLGFVCFSRMDQDFLKNVLETDEVLRGVPGIRGLIKDQSRHGKPRHIQEVDILLLGGITGGYDPRIVNHDMYRLDLHGDTIDKAPLPQALQFTEGSAAACALGNDVIVTSKSQAWRYKTSLNSWTQLGSLKRGRRNHGMAVLNGKVYVVGGDDNLGSLFDVEAYSEKTNKWTKVAPLMFAVSHFGIATCGKKLYVFGGYWPGLYGRIDEAQCYDSTQKKWDSAATLPYAVSHVKACTINSKIYLVGGELDCVLCYHPQEEYYEEMARRLGSWRSWSECSATVCGSEIYITGGWNRITIGFDVKPFSTVQCYDVISDTMIMGKGLPIPVYGHHTVTVSKH
ncbi:kelch-like protein 24 [Branchiostoma floridae]|uniref:Kelch-like protein 24 n=1 Tax=Branchiostoma floridae TaxID=7739 RepID=A0A9J7MYW2_BRAFL|nr:kelch-like protein 24 [Branchiostoma floridae]XP_035683886.1 kelch-like protein 24 [Branchiostoma floridae]